MSLSVNPGDALEQAKARQEAAKQAKETAEKAKADAAAKEAEAAAAAEKEAAEADQAAAKSEKEAADVTAAQEKVNAANVRVNTAQQAYSNALNQLSQAQASGDESAIASAQSAVDRAYQELQKAQQEADEAATQLEKEVNEADEAAKQAETERAEAEQAQKEAEAAKTNLEKADAELTAATQELEAAEAALTEAEAAAQAEEVEGTQAAEHLSQEEIDKLVQEEGYTYITSKEQFLEIFQNGGIDLNGNYILGCDMDLSDIENWQSVGDADNPFKGVFNGNGYSIDNLTINAGDNAENVGFFGVTENATITNVSFNNANVISPDDYINGSSAVGIVAGTARGTTFDNIDVSGSVAGYESVGGLVGVINDNSYFLPDGTPVDVGNSSISNVNTAVDAKGKYFVGGLAGYVKIHRLERVLQQEI